MRDAHVIVGWIVIAANAIAGLWAFAANYREPLRRRELWWFTIAAQVLIFVQALIGVIIQTREDLEPDDFHLLYGFSMIITVGIVYSYRQQMPEHRYLLYAGGGLFIMGLGIRAAFL